MDLASLAFANRVVGFVMTDNLQLRRCGVRLAPRNRLETLAARINSGDSPAPGNAKNLSTS